MNQYCSILLCQNCLGISRLICSYKMLQKFCEFVNTISEIYTLNFEISFCSFGFHMFSNILILFLNTLKTKGFLFFIFSVDHYNLLSFYKLMICLQIDNFQSKRMDQLGNPCTHQQPHGTIKI